MRLESVELIRVKMPLVRPFRTSFGEQTVRDVLLVNAYTSDGPGWGECVAQVDPFYNEEFIDGAQMVLEKWLIPQVLEQQSAVAEDVAELLKNIKGHRSAKAALEMAILDAQLCARGPLMFLSNSDISSATTLCCSSTCGISHFSRTI